jgi:pteridine reductase
MNTSKEKVALVTGSGKQRVGWHVAEALARRGYSLAIHFHQSSSDALQTVRHLEQLGVNAKAYQADLTNESAARDMVQSVVAELGRLDVLVTCAAIWPEKKLEAITAADVRRSFEINTLATFVCCQEAGLRMAQQAEGGAIVTIGDWAIARPYLDHAAYFLSKGTIPTLTAVLAVELAHRNPRVRVNCVLPGPVMLPPTIGADERQRIINATLVKREGQPENVAQAVLALVENDFITGVCLPVDGGRTIYAGDEILRVQD